MTSQQSKLITQKGKPYMCIPVENDYLPDDDDNKIELYVCANRWLGLCYNEFPLTNAKANEYKAQNRVAICANCVNINNVEEQPDYDKDFQFPRLDMGQDEHSFPVGRYICMMYHRDNDCLNGEAQHKYEVTILKETSKFVTYTIRELPNETRSNKPIDEKQYQYRKKKQVINVGSIFRSRRCIGFQVPHLKTRIVDGLILSIHCIRMKYVIIYK
jgi:hypothetical protein